MDNDRDRPVMTARWHRGGLAAVAAVAAVAALIPVVGARGADAPPGTLTVTLEAVSDYVYRGISLTGSDPAFHGGVDYADPSGFYGGIWGSNVDFTVGDEVELDLYAGYSGGGDAAFYDIAIWYYGFPGAGGTADRWEVIGSAGIDYGVAVVAAGVGYSPGYFDAGDGLYVFGEAQVPLPLMGPVQPSLSVRLGHQAIDNAAGFGADDYLEWNFGLTLGFRRVELDLRYHDSDVPAISRLDGGAGFVASLKARF